MRLSDGSRSDDPLGRLADAWNAEEQRARAARVMEAIAASAAGHVRRLGRRADDPLKTPHPDAVLAHLTAAVTLAGARAVASQAAVAFAGEVDDLDPQAPAPVVEEPPAPERPPPESPPATPPIEEPPPLDPPVDDPVRAPSEGTQEG
jgi:hypothetical protein